MIVVDNQQIGFIETNNTNSNINITELHLLNEYRGNRIGTSIIKNIITNTKKEKKNVTIGCFKKNIKAKNLYERLGFIVEKETETHYEMRLKI